MEHLDKAYDILERKLEQAVEKGDAGAMDIIQLTRGMKNILTVDAMLESDSGDMYGMYGRRSYARGRNSRGRYYYDGSYQGGGRGGNSRDGEKDQLMRRLEELRMEVDRMNN